MMIFVLAPLLLTHESWRQKKPCYTFSYFLSKFDFSYFFEIRQASLIWLVLNVYMRSYLQFSGKSCASWLILSIHTLDGMILAARSTKAMFASNCKLALIQSYFHVNFQNTTGYMGSKCQMFTYIPFLVFFRLHQTRCSIHGPARKARRTLPEARQQRANSVLDRIDGTA